MDERDKDRLWEQRENLNDDFMAFSNYFLVAESILLAVVAQSHAHDLSMTEVVLIVIGFALTGVWAYVQGKQKYILDQLKARCAEVFIEYAKIRDLRNRTIWRFSNTAIMSYVMPGLFGVAWLTIAVSRAI